MSHKLISLQVRFNKLSSLVGSCTLCYAAMLGPGPSAPAVGVCHGWLFLTKTSFWLWNIKLAIHTLQWLLNFPPPSAEEISRTWYSTKHERKPGCFQGRLKFRCLTAGFLTRKHQELHLDHWFSVVVDDIMPSQPNQLKDRKHQDIAAVDRVSFESFHELP